MPLSAHIPAFARRVALAALCGALAGAAAFVFLFLLAHATELRDQQPWLVLALPLAGLATGLLYWRFGQSVATGHNLVLEEIHDPKSTVPFRMVPLVVTGTVLTHLFGGSAGREGTAVQMGASLSDQVSRFFRLPPAERRALLIAGTGAGFGAAIGAPIAGVIFGAEVIATGRFRPHAFLESLVASFVGFGVARALGAPHTEYPAALAPAWNVWPLLLIVVVGLASGLSARFFVALTHLVEKAQARFVAYPPLRPFVAGIILVALYYAIGTLRFAGLGLSVIFEAMQTPASFGDPAGKALFTALTVGSGFKGGEFIPLVFIGSTLGSALASLASQPVSFFAGLGFAAAFAGAANTPLACSVMAAELFGWSILPAAFAACALSYLVSGPLGIYRAQRPLRPKHHLFAAALGLLKTSRAGEARTKNRPS